MAEDLKHESNSNELETSSSEEEFYDTASDLKEHASKTTEPESDRLDNRTDTIVKDSIPVKGGHMREDISDQIDGANGEARCKINEDDKINEDVKINENVKSLDDEENETELGNNLISTQVVDTADVKRDCECREDIAHEAAEPHGDVIDGNTREMTEDEEDALHQQEETLTREEKEEKRDEAQNLKKEGNELYKGEEYADSIHKYTEAIKCCPLVFKKERSIMFANRAACKIHLQQLEEGVQDCTKALDLHPQYLKVLLRRGQTYELLDKLEDALTDYQKALELDQGCHLARAACMRLPDEINVKNEKLKEEMMSKLKDLGNLVLSPFGLSTNNFQMQQDPSTGSYSVNFVQNAKTGNGK